MKDKPKVLLIIGNQRRHLYFATSINREFELAGIILVERGKDIPDMPQDIDEIDQINFLKHFKDRSEAEARHFYKIENLTCPILEVGFSELNTENSVRFIQKISPDFVFVFGSGSICIWVYLQDTEDLLLYFGHFIF